MRISDWSSDVCSSDLVRPRGRRRPRRSPGPDARAACPRWPGSAPRRWCCWWSTPSFPRRIRRPAGRAPLTQASGRAADSPPADLWLGLRMRTFATVLIAAGLIAGHAVAQQTAISPDRLTAEVKALADPKLAGRAPGGPGEAGTIAYIVAQFKALRSEE